MRQDFQHIGRGAAWLLVPALMALSACGGAQDKGSLPDAPTTSIACKVAGADDFTNDCALEWLATDAGKDRLFLIHHADGGFRRFIISADGARINAADGAEPLSLEGPTDGKVALSIGTDAYRLTAQDMQPPAPAPSDKADAANSAVATPENSAP